MLAEQLEELLRLMTGGFDQPPRPGRVLLIEVSAHHPLSSHGRLIARRSDLATIAEYSPRFAELVHAGYAWINLSFYGLDVRGWNRRS